MIGSIGAWLARSVLMHSPIGAMIYAVGRGLKRFFGMLDTQGWIGLALSLFLTFKLVHSVGEERHWKKQSAQFEQLYRNEQTAFATTVANYRTAAAQAIAADKANADRVRSEQAKINQEAVDDYETRIAGARAAAERLRQQLASATHSGSGPATPVPLVPAAGGAAQAAGQDGLPVDDRLLATEQAIQLDELIKAARKVMAIDPNEEKKP